MSKDTRERAKDLIIYAVAVISVLIAAGMVVSVAYFGPKIADTNTATEAANQSSETANCRASFSAKATDAQVKMFERKAELDIITNQIVRAAVDQDRPALDALVERSAAKEEEVLNAIAVAEQRVTEFQTAVQRAQADPDAFRVECAKEQP